MTQLPAVRRMGDGNVERRPSRRLSRQTCWPEVPETESVEVGGA